MIPRSIIASKPMRIRHLLFFFSILSLQVLSIERSDPEKLPTGLFDPPKTEKSEERRGSRAQIAGLVFLGVVLLSLVAVSLYFLCRKKEKKEEFEARDNTVDSLNSEIDALRQKEDSARMNAGGFEKRGNQP